jgi:D-alanine-D-alanine ligase
MKCKIRPFDEVYTTSPLLLHRRILDPTISLWYYHSMKKDVLIMFGGQSAEHDVSVITGLQVLENIDRDLYTPIVLYVSKQGEFLLMKDMKARNDFLTTKKQHVVFGINKKGGFITTTGLFAKKYYPYSVYLAFHGGRGESGIIQGMLDAFSLPYTSSNVEGSAVTMNKRITKELLRSANIPTIEGLSYVATEVKENVKTCVENSKNVLGFPVIIKPVHLGSSIGITVAKNEIELELALLEASQKDNEILIEKFIPNIVELNCSVRYVHDGIECSEIERPISKDEILSFKDKYKNGAKKTSGGGMASLSRELPAKIPSDLKQKVHDFSKKAFVICGCKGVVRIDFILSPEAELFLNEINPIPGSMAFYLWETSGIPFKQQITDVIEQSITVSNKEKLQNFDYSTDIVKTFINNKGQ